MGLTPELCRGAAKVRLGAWGAPQSQALENCMFLLAVLALAPSTALQSGSRNCGPHFSRPLPQSWEAGDSCDEGWYLLWACASWRASGNRPCPWASQPWPGPAHHGRLKGAAPAPLPVMRLLWAWTGVLQIRSAHWFIECFPGVFLPSPLRGWHLGMWRPRA